MADMFTEFNKLVAPLIPKNEQKTSFVLGLTRRIEFTLIEENIEHKIKGWMITKRHAMFKHPVIESVCVALVLGPYGLPYTSVNNFVVWNPKPADLPCDVREVFLSMSNLL